MSLRGGALAKNGYFSSRGIRNVYMHAVLNEEILEDDCNKKLENYFTKYCGKPEDQTEDEKMASVLAGKKYKPVALKVRPIYAELPEQYRIKRDITGDPLAGMPKLMVHLPDFIPTGRYTLERKEKYR